MNVLRTRDQGLKDLKDRNEELQDQLEDCQSKQLDDETIKESINNISDAVNSFKAPSCLSAVGVVLSCVGSLIPGFTFCGLAVPTYQTNDGESDVITENVIDEKGNIILVPNIHSNLKVIANQIRATNNIIQTGPNYSSTLNVVQELLQETNTRLAVVASSEQLERTNYTLARIETLLKQSTVRELDEPSDLR